MLRCKRSDFPSRGAPRSFCCSLVDVAGSRLPGQALDFSHGSQTLGQTAAVLSPVTSFHAGSNEGQESLRNSVSRGPAVKLYTEHVQMLDKAGLELVDLDLDLIVQTPVIGLGEVRDGSFFSVRFSVFLINLFRPLISSLS